MKNEPVQPGVFLVNATGFQLPMYLTWSNLRGGDVVGHMHPNELGLLLEDHFSDRRTAAVKVITSSGVTGWMHRADLELVDDECKTPRDCGNIER